METLIFILCISGNNYAMNCISNLYFGIPPLNRMVVGIVAYGKNLAITIEVT